MTTTPKPAYLNATATVKSGKGWLHGVVLAGGSANSTITLYNNTAASGNPICVLSCVIADNGVVMFPRPLRFGTGLHAVLAGTGALATVYYE